MATLTSANSVILLGVTNLLPLTQIQGYTADELWTTEAIDNAETTMGLDGILSAGWIPVPVPVNFMIQGNSPSASFFETWFGAELAAQDKYECFGSITIPGLKRSYTGKKGFLRNYSPIPGGGKIIQPRQFQIQWETLVGIAI